MPGTTGLKLTYVGLGLISLILFIAVCDFVITTSNNWCTNPEFEHYATTRCHCHTLVRDAPVRSIALGCPPQLWFSYTADIAQILLMGILFSPITAFRYVLAII